MKIPLRIPTEEAAKALLSLIFRHTVKGVLYSVVIHGNLEAKGKFVEFLRTGKNITIPDVLEYKPDALGTMKVIDIIEDKKEGDIVHLRALFGCIMGNFVNKTLTETALELGLSEEDLERIDFRLKGNIIVEYKRFMKNNYDIKLIQKQSETDCNEDIFYSEVKILKDYEGYITLKEEYQPVIPSKPIEKTENSIKIREGSEKERIEKFLLKKEIEEIENSMKRFD